MRLTKKEKQVDQLIADGHSFAAITAAIQVSDGELFGILGSLKAKYEADKMKEARRKDIIMCNEYVAPRISGLKCKNLDRENPNYWFFTGYESDVLIAHERFTGLGINAPIRKNGDKGKFWLIVPSWVTCELTPATYQELTLNNENLGSEGENYYVNDNSITDSTDTTANCFETGFEYFGEFQSQDTECFA